MKFYHCFPPENFFGHPWKNPLLPPHPGKNPSDTRGSVVFMSHWTQSWPRQKSLHRDQLTSRANAICFSSETVLPSAPSWEKRVRNSFDRWLTPARRVHVPSPPFRLNFSLLLSAVNRKAKKRRRKTNFCHGDISCSKKKLQAKSRVKLCTEKSYRAFFVAARLYQLIKHLRTFCPIYLPLQSSNGASPAVKLLYAAPRVLRIKVVALKTACRV